MAKKDITVTSETNYIHSRSQQKIDQEKALEVLERAKAIPRKVFILKQGEGNFSRELRKEENTEEMLISKDAATYLLLSYNTFTRRQKKTKIPYVKKNGNNKYFRISDLDNYQTRYANQ